MMKRTILAAAMMTLALGAGAEGLPQLLESDPLSRQILTKTAQENGGVTAAVRVASGQVIALQIADVSSAPAAAASLAPAASSPEASALKTAAALTAKAEKPKAKKPLKRAVDQLKHAASTKTAL